MRKPQKLEPIAVPCDASATCVAAVVKHGKAVACGKSAFQTFVNEFSGSASPLCARHFFNTLRHFYKVRALGEIKD